MLIFYNVKKNESKYITIQLKINFERRIDLFIELSELKKKNNEMSNENVYNLKSKSGIASAHK